MAQLLRQQLFSGAPTHTSTRPQSGRVGRSSCGFRGVTRPEGTAGARNPLLDRDGDRIRRAAIRNQNDFDLTAPGEGTRQRSDDD